MRVWMSPPDTDRTGYVDLGSDCYLRDTPAYLEVSYPLGLITEGEVDGIYVYVYWLRESEYNYYVCTSWGQHFDVVNFLSLDEQCGRGVQASIEKEWPLFFGLWKNAVLETGQDRFRRIVDPDDGSAIWVLGRVLGNVQISTVDDLDSGRSREEANNVVGLERVA